MLKPALKEAVNLLSRKAKENSLGTLDEKQIQERLYGKYHRENNSGPTPSVRIGQPPDPKEFVPGEQRNHLFEEWKALRNAWGQAIRQFFNGFPWKAVASIEIALIAAVLIVQSVSQWMSNQRLSGSMREFQTQSKPIQTLKAPAAAPALKVVSSQRISSSSEPPPPPSLPVIKQKYYAVQICTYQREKDAEALVKQLQALHFPAFYKRTLSEQERIALFVVFLDRAETYAQAKSQLSEFRKTELFQQFSDSFIRSLLFHNQTWVGAV